MIRVLHVLMIIVLVGYLSMVKGQSIKHQFAGHLGVASGILDNGFGLNLGLTASQSLSRFFALEGQASYTKAGVSSFLSGEKERIGSLSLLVGGRLYLTSPQKSIRPYLNFLVGGAFVNERRIGSATTSTDEFTAGASTGLYVEVKRKLFFGVSVESPSFLILRGGYAF